MSLAQTRDVSLRAWQVFAWTALLGYCLFSGMKYSEDILLVQAFGGWSPMDWVGHQLLPDNFKADFPSGISAYRMSSFMQLYKSAARLGADLEALIPWVIQFEILFLGIGAAALFRVLVPRAPLVAMAVFAVLVVEGGARGMELARFGGAFYQGLYYNVADGLRLLGLAALFRGKLVLAALLLGLGFTVHPIMAGMACLFAIPFVLLVLRRFPFRRWLLAGVVFLIVAGAWVLFRMQSAEVASGGIPADTWMGLVRMFSYHWFPVDIGVFTRMHERYILPLLCLVSLAVLYLPRVVQGRAECLGVAWGMAVLAILSCAGVLVSEFSSEPFLIKLALHRASDMLILVSLLIVVAGLAEEVLEGRFFESALGGALLLSPLVNMQVAFPVVATMALVALHVVRARIGGETRRFLMALASLVVLLIAVSLYYFMGIPNDLAYLGWPFFWMTALVFLVAAAFRWCGDRAKMPLVITRSLLGFALLCAVLFFSVASVERKTLMPDERKEASSDYLAVQRWARANTPSDSLFLVDPTIYYGWRDFSQRSSFGNLREWLHTGWLYDSRATVYQEGLRRFGEFGIDIEPYKQIRPSIDGYHRLSDDLRQVFYSKNKDWFQELSQRYGIGYLVLQKKFSTGELHFEKAFENSCFVVYRLRE